jgi:hypothetical protein
MDHDHEKDRSRRKRREKDIHFELNPPTVANNDPNTAAPMYNLFRLPSLSLRAAPVKAPVKIIISLSIKERERRGLVKDGKSKGVNNRCR